MDHLHFYYLIWNNWFFLKGNWTIIFKTKKEFDFCIFPKFYWLLHLILYEICKNTRTENSNSVKKNAWMEFHSHRHGNQGIVNVISHITYIPNFHIWISCYHVINIFYPNSIVYYFLDMASVIFWIRMGLPIIKNKIKKPCDPICQKSYAYFSWRILVINHFHTFLSFIFYCY